MVEHKTEEEQIEAVKRWWSENGRVVVIAVVIGVSGSFGWQFWQDYKQERREQAALEYWQFVEFLEKDFISIDVSRPDIIGDKIKSDFPKSNYSKFTAMHLAKIYVDAEKFDKAEDELRWVLRESGSADAISQVASIRLARVLAAMGESTKAIEILSSKQDASFKALRATVLGDIMWNLGEKEAAIKEYQDARDLSNGAFVPPRLMEKLSFLGARSPEADSVLNIHGDAENAKKVSDQSEE